MRQSLLIVAAVVACSGCRRAEVTHFQVRKESATTASAAPWQSSAQELPVRPVASGASTLTWTLPKGWTQSLAGGIRYATLKAPVDGNVDVSVVVLPGPAGGELANVNRWRGQLGLPPTDERGLGASRTSIRSKAGTVAVHDFSSEGTTKSRMVAALLISHETTWFVKMIGDEGAVSSARADFVRVLQSVRFNAAN